MKQKNTNFFKVYASLIPILILIFLTGALQSCKNDHNDFDPGNTGSQSSTSSAVSSTSSSAGSSVSSSSSSSSGAGGTELLSNGDFSNGDTSWQPLWVGGGAAAGSSVVGGEYIVNVTTADAYWTVDLAYSSVSLEDGIEYQLTFDARIISGSAIPLKVLFKTTSGGWLYVEDFDLTSSMTTYEFSFTATNSVTAQIDFLLGAAAGETAIDNVSLLRLDGGGSSSSSISSSASSSSSSSFSSSSSSGPLSPEVAKVFRDNMVLQRDANVPVWGTAPDGYTVSVSFNGQDLSTVVTNGKWKLHLAAMTANAAGQEMSIKFYNGPTLVDEITIVNILIGDVYLAGGQSNMNLLLWYYINLGTGTTTTDNPLIRLYKFPELDEYGEQPASWATSWGICGNNDQTKNMSATAYHFAVQLQPYAGVPIGIIQSAVGATPIEAWMSEEALLSDPDLVPVLGRRNDPSFTHDRYNPTILFDQMIEPLLPFKVKAFLWYQGENNASLDPVVGAIPYRKLFPTLIDQWRSDFEVPGAPFFFVQLASFGGFDVGSETFGNDTTWAFLREAQYLTLDVADTGMVCALDLGEKYEIHPDTKQEVGRRLSLLARDRIYSESIVSSGPILTGHTVLSDRIVLSFDHIGSGLKAAGGGPLVGFEIASLDRVYVEATAVIVGNTVEVNGIASPAYVRYAWKNWPEYTGVMANLFNNEDLPASPFRTDYTVGEPVPTVSYYQASGNFSGIQGENDWYYQEWNGSAYSDLSYDSGNNKWTGSQTWLAVYSLSCHPEAGLDAVRVWQAPAAGTIWITGDASKEGVAGGDGVIASIKHNSSELWSSLVAPETAVTPTGVSAIPVNAGDKIYFHINANANTTSDYTAWDPKIEFIMN